MLPGAPPFVESETIVGARKVASRLAASELPIMIDGEVGTGRRTLAEALASLRSRGKHDVITFSGFDGAPDAAREAPGTTVLVLHHAHALDGRGQARVAALVRERRVMLVATTKSNEGALAPELSALVDATRVTLPPLRERAPDACAWAAFFATRAATELGCPMPTFTAEARRAIGVHRWPGNLSELESVIRRAVVLRQGDEIGPSDLGFTAGLVVQPLNDAVENFRMAYVADVLAHFDGNRTQAAKALGVDPRTMFRYLAKAKNETT